MLKRILDVDYDALSQYLLDKKSSSEHQDDPNFLEFEYIQAYLSKEAERMEPCSEDVDVDQDLVNIFMEDLYPDQVLSITVTRLPGMVHRYADHLLKLPLILIEVEWSVERNGNCKPE